jgi:hypothetical protein
LGNLQVKMEEAPGIDEPCPTPEHRVAATLETADADLRHRDGLQQSLQPLLLADAQSRQWPDALNTTTGSVSRTEEPASLSGLK